VNDDEPDPRFDDQLRHESAARASLAHAGIPDLDRVQKRANALTNRRRAWQAGAVVLGVLAVGSAGLYLANGTSSGSDAQIASDGPSATSTPLVDSTPTPETPPTVEEQLLSQLEERPDVRQHLLGVTSVDGLVLCGLNDLGHSKAQDELFVWLYCGSYTTGPKAQNVSAGTDPAVVSVETGVDGTVRVVDVTFPPMGDQAEDIRTMFPPQVAERVISGGLTSEPTEDALLQIARTTTTD
jgi:hypothetical protein